jgi:hypothetical protein
MHSSGLEFAVARPIPISGDRVMSSAWRMTPSVTDACRSERLHYRLRPALGDRDLSSRHRGLFEALDRETDPVLIAQQADKRPVFPSLEAADNGVTGAATSAESEPAVIGIMDPHAAPDSIDSWAPPVETGPRTRRTGRARRRSNRTRRQQHRTTDPDGAGPSTDELAAPRLKRRRSREPRRLTKISGVDDVRSSAVAGCD